jgi:hypothetical protein
LIFFLHTGHLLTLATHNWETGTGLQVVFLDLNGRAGDIGGTEMVYGAGHFTEMTAAAPFRIYTNPHVALL